MINALSIDMEDYFQAKAMESVIHFQEWGQQASRIRSNVHRLLNLFQKFRTRATFFILAWNAEHYPGLVKDVQREGHEIACHGYKHMDIYRQTQEEFRADIGRSKKILEQIAHVAIRGYRAPTFSIRQDTLWALDILIEEGFRYDSSIFPIFHDRYGIPASPRFPYRVRTPKNKSIREFPLSTINILGQNFPVAGGGYFRLLPYPVVHRAILQLNRKEKRPAVIYLHPWELDPDQPRLPIGPLNQFRHYLNLHKTEEKLVRLLQDFRFAPLGEILAREERKVSLPLVQIAEEPKDLLETLSHL
jgi:polysaccharide deacetylase family protein (PEP-CTERM system associated)